MIRDYWILSNFRYTLIIQLGCFASLVKKFRRAKKYHCVDEEDRFLRLTPSNGVNINAVKLYSHH